MAPIRKNAEGFQYLGVRADRKIEKRQKAKVRRHPLRLAQRMPFHLSYAALDFIFVFVIV